MLDATSASGLLSDRIIVRFGATLAANLVRAGLSFVSGILIARGLGASGYGDLNFLLGSFAAISQLLEMGTSSAFYTFISQRRRSRAIVTLYLCWVVFQFVATVLAVALLLPGTLIERIWVGHERETVLLAFGASFLMTQAWGVVSQLGEATRKTVIVQAAAVAQSVVHLALVAASVYWGWMTVPTVLWLLVGEYTLLAIILGPRLVRENLTNEPNDRDECKIIARKFVAYCKPLVVYGWVSFLYAFADRWLLQEFGGPEQQGFFAIGQQFANISLIATTSILKVFWKEIAEAFDRKDHRQAQALYISVSRGLYFSGAWLSCLLIPYSGEVLAWTVGPGFESAWLCLALMFLYPIHQSLGQVQGTYSYASGATRSYAWSGVLMMVISIPVTYFLLAPTSARMPGLGLGAVGLAAKMVILQIVGLSILGYLIARTNGWDYDCAYQVIVLALLLSMGWICKLVSSQVLVFTGSIGGAVGVVLLGSGLYIALSGILLSKFPSMAGLTREHVKHALAVLTRRPWPAVRQCATLGPRWGRD